ncbi:hypothetical protein ACLB6K_17445 [Microcystis aeruginosa FACHB-524]|uniref:hypothetical protein n=1 Tax=Microcystis aeruginosa TaxID=1126 RepID=UPI000F449C3B|nr:hypothetical protein [Microcystis aeruginosa]ROH98645.1 hypothetical protein ED562_17300 [Microcystis aeruginosa FACHB-524]
MDEVNEQAGADESSSQNVNEQAAADESSSQDVNEQAAASEFSWEEISKKLKAAPGEISKKLASWGVSLDEVAKRIGSLGLPGVILVVTVSTSGATTYPIAFALAALGGPLGVLGGLGLLGLTTVVGDALTNYGIEAVLAAIYKDRRKQEAQEDLIKEVEGLPITQGLKLKLKQQIESAEVVSEDIGSPQKIEIAE